MTFLFVFENFIDGDQDAGLFHLPELMIDSGAEYTHLRGEAHISIDQRRHIDAELADFLVQDLVIVLEVVILEKLLHFFGLEEKPIKKMSKGQKAKAEVAAGMAKKAHIFIMDEPFIGKDMFTRQDFMQALAGSLTGEETIFITTHEIDEIENFIDRALILKNGEIAADVRMDALRQENKSLQSLMKEVTGYKEGNLEELLS